MKKITLLGVHPDTGNRGVGALMVGAVSCVRHAWPDAEISLLEYDDRPKTFSCRISGTRETISMIPLRFSMKFYLRNNIAMLIMLSIVMRLIPFHAIKKRILDGNSCLSHLHDADMVLSIAGGDSFSDIYGMERFVYITLPQLLTLAMRKKLVLMPQTIGPFKHLYAVCIAAFIMKRAAAVYARDTESLVVAKKLIGKAGATKARFCYDMGCILDPVKPSFQTMEAKNGKKREKPLVGLNVSGLLCIGGYNRNNMFALKIDYKELVRSLICYLIEEKKTVVILVPHVFGTIAESDTAAISLIFNELTGRYGKDLFAVNGDHDQHEIKYIIGQCDFFIGSRMHACIAALSQCIPAVGIAYSRKFEGVMRSLDVGELVADPRLYSTEAMLALIGKSIDSRDIWARRLREKMPEVKNTVYNLFVDKQLFPLSR